VNLSPESDHSMFDRVPRLGVVASHKAYQVRALRFHYHPLNREAANWVLDGLTFDVDAGQILGIVGPNGSGKTSLLKLLAKVLRPNAGVIGLFERDLGTMPQGDVARTVAFVPQESPQVFADIRIIVVRNGVQDSAGKAPRMCRLPNRRCNLRTSRTWLVAR